MFGDPSEHEERRPGVAFRKQLEQSLGVATDAALEMVPVASGDQRGER